MAVPPAAAAASVAPSPARPITLARQLALGVAMSGLSVGILAMAGRPAATLLEGVSLPAQFAIGGALSALAGANAWFACRRGLTGCHARKLIEGYRRLDLRGWNPVWFALCAGIWEELLFRGSLQPEIGLAPAALVFSLAHARAYRFWPLDRNGAVQVAGLFGAGVMLGLLVRHVGLFAAMMLHASVDVGGLLTVRAAQQRAALGQPSPGTGSIDVGIRADPPAGNAP